MLYAEFEAPIASPALKEIARHWNEARKSRVMPGWSDIKPSRIAHHLRWSGRSAMTRRGTNSPAAWWATASPAISARISGACPLAQAYPPEALPWARKMFDRVVHEPALYAHAGPLFTQMHSPHPGERILLPLSEDGVEVDGVLGATYLHDATSMPITLLPPDPEAERWYSLPRRT